ncbi:MAG TPA: nuclear transport factor 2 family protein, partial [Terriglobales bacterium]|nr:nuclear transport factor 2 family protein [Terriglobales bacterium]
MAGLPVRNPDERTQALILQAYSAFNQRDVDGVLGLMTESVNWPRASEGGRAIGKREIREYWARQWAEIDPRVEVLAMKDRGNG